MPNNTTWFSSGNASILCSLEDGERKYDSYVHAMFLSFAVIVILSPVAVSGNALILAAIWKKTFQRTPFHILLSGLAFTDLCTGLITQPLFATPYLLYFANAGVVIAHPVLITTIFPIGVVSAVYFGAITLLIMTLMSIERWLHMSRRSLVTLRRGCLTVAVVLLIPIPLVVFKTVTIIKGTSHRQVNITLAAGMLLCYLTTCVAYFKVFRIIRQHQQQVQGNQSSQSVGQPAINLAKYKKSVLTILYILALFSSCFLPVMVIFVVRVHVGNMFETEIAFIMSLVLVFLSSSLNPCLYLWRMSDIRN